MAGGKFPSKTSGLAYSNFPQISNVEQQGISVRKSKTLQSDRQAYRLLESPRMSSLLSLTKLGMNHPLHN